MSNATSPAAPVLALDADGEEFALDFGYPDAPARTPEDAAAHKSLLERQDVAGASAYNGAMASGLGKPAASRAAAKARRETA